MRDRSLWTLFGGLSSVPLAGVLGLYLLGLVATVQLGHWPGADEPKDLALGPLRGAVLLLFLMALCSLALWPIGGWYFRGRRPVRSMMLLYAAGWSLWVIQKQLDPLGLLRWYFD